MLIVVTETARVRRTRRYIAIPEGSEVPLYVANQYYSLYGGDPDRVGFWSKTSGALETYMSYGRGDWPFYGSFDGMSDEEVDIAGYPDYVWSPQNIIMKSDSLQYDKPSYDPVGQNVYPGEWRKYFDVWPYTFDTARFNIRGFQGLPWSYQREIAPGFIECLEIYDCVICKGFKIEGPGGMIAPLAAMVLGQRFLTQ